MLADDNDQLDAGAGLTVVGIELNIGEYVKALKGANRFLHVLLGEFNTRLQADRRPDQRFSHAFEVTTDFDFLDRGLCQTRHSQQDAEQERTQTFGIAAASFIHLRRASVCPANGRMNPMHLRQSGRRGEQKAEKAALSMRPRDRAACVSFTPNRVRLGAGGRRL